MKRCSRCRIEKPKGEFYPRQRSRDGLQANCKVCNRVAALESYRRRRTLKSPEEKARSYRQMGERKRGRWMTDEPQYAAVHRRVRLVRGRPVRCEDCGTETAPHFEWALRPDAIPTNLRNRDGLAYSVSVEDYMALCGSCHHSMDGTIRNIVGEPA